MHRVLLALSAVVILLSCSGCMKSMESAAHASWKMVRPIGYVFEMPSRALAGQPPEREEEVAYEKAYIERTLPASGGTAVSIDLDEEAADEPTE